MFDKIKNLLKSKQPEQTEKQEEKTSLVQKSKYDFVEQYVITDRLLHVGCYEMWSLGNTTPVAYDNNGQGGWLATVELPNPWAQDFLKKLKTSSKEIRKDPKQRLISIINMKDNHKIYIVPSLADKNRSVIIPENVTDKQHYYDWLLYVTP